MPTTKYTMPFTTGGLFLHESMTVAGLYLALGDWTAVRDRVISGNLLQTRTVNTARRIIGEISARLELLTEEEMGILMEGSRQDRQHILWMAVCRRYRFIREFAVEVIRRSTCASI